MPALPARRIASSALCAALLVGIAGPVAMAADSVGGQGHVAPEARLPGADARLVQIGRLHWGDLTPVADLLNAVLRDGNGRLSATEARKLGDAAKAAVARAAARNTENPDESTVVLLPAPVLPAVMPVAPEPRAADPVGDLLELVLGAVDGLLETITSGVGGVLPTVDELLGGVDDLLAALVGSDLLPAEQSTSATSSSAPADTSALLTPEAVTYPDVPLLTPALPPAP
ncbi:hypothetical protein [Streptomyces viridochromogenes]|nr:hypothetical protein [Streptomyces viridochromogenes]